MANATAVLTGDLGPGGSVTALNITEVLQLEFDFQHNMINIIYGNGKVLHMSWTGVTTVTFSISGGNATVTVS